MLGGRASAHAVSEPVRPHRDPRRRRAARSRARATAARSFVRSVARDGGKRCLVSMRVDVEETVEAFAEAGARVFAETANEAIAARGRFVVALTGGSTPLPIHRAL